MQEDGKVKLLETEEKYRGIFPFDSDEDDTEESINGDAGDLDTEVSASVHAIYFTSC